MEPQLPGRTPDRRTCRARNDRRHHRALRTEPDSDRISKAVPHRAGELLRCRPAHAVRRVPSPLRRNAIRHRAAAAPLHGKLGAGLSSIDHSSKSGRGGRAISFRPRRYCRQHFQTVQRHRDSLCPILGIVPALGRARGVSHTGTHSHADLENAGRHRILLRRAHDSQELRRIRIG